MQLSSSVFDSGEKIPTVYTCQGEGINPPLTIEGVPTHTKSLVLIMDDPDAPDGLFTHWLIYNLSPEIIFIPENTTPDGAEMGVNSGGQIGYYPPCPNSGTHRYFFRLYALNQNLNLKPGATRSEVNVALDGKAIMKAELYGIVSSNLN